MPGPVFPLWPVKAVYGRPMDLILKIICYICYKYASAWLVLPLETWELFNRSDTCQRAGRVLIHFRRGGSMFYDGLLRATKGTIVPHAFYGEVATEPF